MTLKFYILDTLKRFEKNNNITLLASQQAVKNHSEVFYYLKYKMRTLQTCMCKNKDQIVRRYVSV